MQKIKLTDPLSKKVYIRELPENWQEVPVKKRALYARHLFTLSEVKAMLEIGKDVLDLPKTIWYNLDPALLAAMVRLIKLDTLPSATPIIECFTCRFKTYSLPSADFENGSVGEFILALDHYEEYAKTNDPADLYRLFATLARVHRHDAGDRVKFNDVREPIFDNAAQPESAKRLKKMPIEYALITLRYFEGVKKMIYEEGLRLNLWKMPENKTEGKEDVQNPVNLFGWRSVLRGLADGDVQKYDALFQRRFWEIFQILMERQAAADFVQSQMPKNETD